MDKTISEEILGMIPTEEGLKINPKSLDKWDIEDQQEWIDEYDVDVKAVEKAAKLIDSGKKILKGGSPELEIRKESNKYISIFDGEQDDPAITSKDDLLASLLSFAAFNGEPTDYLKNK